MRPYLCKQLFSSLSDRTDNRVRQQETAMPSLLKQLQSAIEADKADRKSGKKEASRLTQSDLRQQEGSHSHSSQLTHQGKSWKASNRHKKASSSSSKGSQKAHHEFQRAAAMAAAKVYTDHESLPGYESAFAVFLDMYPRYTETAVMDTLREEEYGHLKDTDRVCMDYCGFGLFSHLQQVQQWESASFALSTISVNLCSHSLFGSAEDGTIECDIRKRIMGYLNILETDYSMVFTASRGASFKLLADAYPFETCSRLITMYDYESESVSWMLQRAKEKGAKVSNVTFKLPSLRIVSTKLRKLLAARRRQRGPAKDLFVSPVQSRVSGAKYSYQWMSLAQQNKWHVLLDASSIGPKDMDSLGLSLFRPDFIIASFYKLFGGDPSGFGCLFIRNSVIQTLQDESGAPATGIVRLIPYPLNWSLSESSEGDPNENEEEGLDGKESVDFEFQQEIDEITPMVASFSGPMLGFKNSPSEETSKRLPPIEGVMEEEEDDSSVCDSLGEVTRSPVFSEDGTDNLFCIDVGPSPVGTASHTSMSEGPFSGPFSGPIHNPVYDGGTDSSTRTLQNPLFESSTIAENGEKFVESKGNEGTYIINHYQEVDGLGGSDNENDCVKNSELASARGLTQRLKEIELLEPGPSPCIGIESSMLVSNHKLQRYKDDDIDKSKSLWEGEVFHYKMDKLLPVSRKQENNLNSQYRRAGNLSDAGSQEVHGVREQINDEINVFESEHGSIQGKHDLKQKSEGKAALIQSESAIRRETEGNFRLLGRRNGDRLLMGRSLSPILQDPEELNSSGGRESYMEAEVLDSTSFPDHEERQSGDFGDAVEHEDELEMKEPEVVCRSLDHADMLGLNKSTIRLRYLINWLISSLLQLRHPGPEDNLPLVQIYGPQIRYDRGASLAFNLYNCHGQMLHPELVQMLAEKKNVSLSIGFLKNLQLPESSKDFNRFLGSGWRNANTSKSLLQEHGKGVLLRIEVVTAALSILSDFEDVYKLWVFVARFLDADFVAKELGGQSAPTGEVISREL